MSGLREGAPPTEDARAPRLAGARASAVGGRLASPDFQFRAFPALVAVAIVLLLLFLPGLIVDFLSNYIWLPVHGSPLASLIASDLVMLLIALGAIWLMRRRGWSDCGLHLPSWPTYVPSALLFGILFGALMTFVDYAPEIFRRVPPHGFETHQLDVVGWLAYYGIVAGPCWEIPFRGLLLTYLFWAMPGVIRWRNFEIAGAGLYVAALFAVPWAFYNAVAQSFLIGIGEGLYVFVGSAALAWWFERSKSVAAPIVGHAAATFTWQALVFAMIEAWR